MHTFNAHLIWDGNLGDGTSSYTQYGRQYRAVIEGKPDLHGSAAPEFRGEASRHNPEDLFVTAIASCHMLSYLALCAKARINVVKYEDQASGTMSLDARGGGRFEEVVLRPVVTIAAGGDVNKALTLHHKAHEVCFIANSCSVPIRHEATIQIES